MRYIPKILSIYIFFCTIYYVVIPYWRGLIYQDKNHKFTMFEFGSHLLLLAVSSILVLKLWPVYLWRQSDGVWGDIILLIDRPSYKSSLWLIPFSSIQKYITFIKVGVSDIWGVVTNLFGNIICFIPIGFLPPLLFRDYQCRQIIISGIALSMITEFGQYFIMRVASIDDVFLNTAGTICGYLLFRFFAKIYPTYVENFRLPRVSKQNR